MSSDRLFIIISLLAAYCSSLPPNPIDIKTTTSHKYISNNSSSTIAVLFEISTTSINKSSTNKHLREPYELVIVLDRSGSMSSQNKLEQAKTAMINIVENMIEEDIIHIVQYDDNVQTIIQNGKHSSKQEIINTISKISTAGSTNLFGGLERGYNILRDSIFDRNKEWGMFNHKNIISHSRVFLFSDGLLNVGITNQQQILNEIRKWKNEYDLTISTFGIGWDFDRKIMTSIAEQGNGDFFFIDSAESILNIVDIARKDAANVVGTEAILTIKTVNNSNVDIKLNDLFQREILDKNEFSKYNQIKINDLRDGGHKYVVIELVTNPTELIFDEYINILEWELSFKAKGNYDDDEKKYITGNVNIQIKDDDDKILINTNDNINDEVLVFWKLNKMTSLDAEIITDIEKGNYKQAVHTRGKRQTIYNKMNEDGSRYNDYISKSESIMGGTIKSMYRRSSNQMIENEMNKLEAMVNKKDYSKLKENDKEKLLLQYQSEFMLNEDAASDHDNL